MSRTLYSLHLSSHKDGFGKPSVASVETAGMIGHLCAVSGKIVVPDRDAVRAALPHYYRKAFDRGLFFFNKHDNSKSVYMTLRGARGQYLNTLYAIPYVYSAAVAA